MDNFTTSSNFDTDKLNSGIIAIGFQPSGNL
jgi:hypothetical protein